jgi:hypothetical protein
VRLALPALDAMLDGNGEALADGAPLPRRFGVWWWGVGVRLDRWVPSRQGAGYPATPELQPLFDAGVAGDVSVVSGLDDPFPTVLPHHDGWVSMMTGSNERTPADRPGNGLFVQPSIDQVVARAWKGQARFDSLQLLVSRMGPSCNATDGVGISQLGGGQVNPGLHDPAALWALLFGGLGDTPAAVARTIADRTSMLDAVSDDAQALRARLGTVDRARIDQYLDGVRAIERRLQRTPPACEQPLAPAAAGDPLEREDLVGRGRLLADLLALALACDLTRVFTLEFTPMQAMTLFWQLGSTSNYHRLTHLGDAAIADRAATFAMGEFAYLLGKLRATPEGSGTLLDSCGILATSEVAQGDTHARHDMPILVAGGAGGGLRSGVHYRSPSGESVTRAHLTLLRALGLPAASFGVAEGYTTDALPMLAR